MFEIVFWESFWQYFLIQLQATNSIDIILDFNPDISVILLLISAMSGATLSLFLDYILGVITRSFIYDFHKHTQARDMINKFHLMLYLMLPLPIFGPIIAFLLGINSRTNTKGHIIMISIMTSAQIIWHILLYHDKL